MIDSASFLKKIILKVTRGNIFLCPVPSLSHPISVLLNR